MAFAATIDGQTISTTDVKASKKKWKAIAYLDTRSGLENESGAAGSLTSTFQGYFYYNLGAGYKARMMVAAYHDFRKEERANELYNGYLAINKKFKLNPIITISGDTRAYLPLSRIEREKKSFQTKLYIAPKISADLTRLGLKGLTVAYRVIGTHSFYRYHTGISGAVNSKNSFAHQIDISYAPIDRLEFNTYFRNTHKWSYYGTRTPDSFLFEIEGSYRLTKGLSVALGYTVGDTTFGHDGTSLDVDLLDLTKSSVYTSLTYSF